MIDVFAFIWFTIFFWHEICHIKGQFLGGWYIPTGRINVKKWSMSSECDNVWNGELYYCSGGLLSSILTFWFVFRTTDIWQFSFFTLGWIHLIYGLYEWKYPFVRWRYAIYIGVTALCILFWWKVVP